MRLGDRNHPDRVASMIMAQNAGFGHLTSPQGLQQFKEKPSTLTGQGVGNKYNLANIIHTHE